MVSHNIVVGKKETDLIVYYVDGTDKKDANITKIKYGNNKVVFNSDEFLYKIARGRAGLTSNDEMDWEKEAKRKQKEEEERELKKKIMQETDWTESYRYCK